MRPKVKALLICGLCRVNTEVSVIESCVKSLLNLLALFKIARTLVQSKTILAC